MFFNHKNLFKKTNNREKKANNHTRIEFLNLGQLVKEQREKHNISIASLSRKTKISVTVIEAIENGWTRKLPESTYLASMLLTIESELNLERGSLKYIKNNSQTNYINDKKNTISINQKYSLSDLPTILTYFSLIIISIFLLNRYQVFLSKQNVQTIAPIPIEIETKENSQQKDDSIQPNDKSDNL